MPFAETIRLLLEAATDYLDVRTAGLDMWDLYHPRDLHYRAAARRVQFGSDE